MTDNIQNNVNQTQENKPSDKELNFRALESKFQKALEDEKLKRVEAEKKAEQAMQNQMQKQDDDDSDPYVDNKKLDRKLNYMEQKLEEKFERKAEEKARRMIEKEKQEMWIKGNPDFYDTLQNHAERFAQQNPNLAEAILRMPDNFERQILVYNNIKALGIDKPQQKQPSIQEKIDANRKSPYYQPTGVGTSPYSSSGDFSPTGQKQAYDKMQELKSRLRLG